jgi:hypothetical protein
MGTKGSAFLALALGAALLAAAGYMGLQVKQLIAVAAKAEGTVVDFERRSSKGGTSYAPVFAFTAADGATRRFTTSGSGDYKKGESVEVLYDPQNPEDARLNTFMELWFGSLAVGAFGLLCLGAGIGTLVYERTRRTKSLRG